MNVRIMCVRSSSSLWVVGFLIDGRLELWGVGWRLLLSAAEDTVALDLVFKSKRCVEPFVCYFAAPIFSVGRAPSFL